MIYKYTISTLLIFAVTGTLLVLFLNPRFTIICDDYLGGRMQEGAYRGFQCECAGWKFYLKNDAPADGRDLSVCIGRIKKFH